MPFASTQRSYSSTRDVEASEASVTPGWSQTSSRESAPGAVFALALGPRQHERLVPELVERRAQVAADHGLAAVEPLA